MTRARNLNLMLSRNAENISFTNGDNITIMGINLDSEPNAKVKTIVGGAKKLRLTIPEVPPMLSKIETKDDGMFKKSAV
jgi:hypothetical protein